MESFISIRNRNKKAQAWGLDLVMAVVIFLVAIVILYLYALNYSSSSKNQLEGLFYEGQLASDLILSEDDFGILTESKVNQTKLDEYSTDYTNKKATLGVINDFYFIIEDSYYGKQNTTQVENSIKITRIAIYHNRPTKLELYVWN